MNRMIIATGLVALLATAPAFAQGTTAPTAPKAPAATSAQKTDELLSKPVYSSDNKSLGAVSAVMRDSDGKVTKLDSDIGGFLGIGQHRISLTPTQFTVSPERVTLQMTAEQAKALPAVATK